MTTQKASQSQDSIWADEDSAYLRIAIEEDRLTMISAYRLYLTFARKPLA